MPPTQKVAATRWIQIRIMLKKFTFGSVTRLAGTHHHMRYSIRDGGHRGSFDNPPYPFYPLMCCPYGCSRRGCPTFPSPSF
jgi:hypothetical protein